MKFLKKSGKTGLEIIPMLNNVYVEVTLKKSAVYDWIQHFRDGWEDVNDYEERIRHIETRTPSNVELVKQLLDLDHRLSIKDVAGELSINHGTICLTMKDELHLCLKNNELTLHVER